MFTFTLLEVGNCKRHGVLGFRETLHNELEFGGAHVYFFLFLLKCRGWYCFVQFRGRLFHDSHQHRPGIQVHLPHDLNSSICLTVASCNSVCALLQGHREGSTGCCVMTVIFIICLPKSIIFNILSSSDSEAFLLF